MKLDASKIQKWIEENAELLSESIPVELCASHEDGGETCWGQDGHVWGSGHHQILTICHPRAEEVLAATPCRDKACAATAPENCKYPGWLLCEFSEKEPSE